MTNSLDALHKGKHHVSIYMCRPIVNDYQQLKDLYIHWQNPKSAHSKQFPFVKPGAYLSELAGAGIALPNHFWDTLHNDGIAEEEFQWADYRIHLLVFATDKEYAVTLSVKPLCHYVAEKEKIALRNALFQYAGLGIALTDREGIIKSVNPALENMTGYVAEELIDKESPAFLRVPSILKKQIEELLPEQPADMQDPDTVVMTYLNSHSMLQRENTLLTKNRRYLPVLSTTTKLYDDENNFFGFVDFVADISEFKKIQRELFLANQRLKLATKAGNIGIWEYNGLTNEFIWDEETYRIHGIPPGTAVTFEDFLKLIHPEDQEYFYSRMGIQEFDSKPIRIIRPDGAVKYVKSQGIKLPGRNGMDMHTIGIVLDVTDNILSQITLSDSEKRYRFLVENLKEVVFQTDLQGRWTYLNQSWVEITGFDISSSMGITCLEFVHPDDRERNLELITGLVHQKKEYCRNEVRYMHKDGSHRWIEIFAKLTYDETGRPTGTIGTLYDISERKQMEMELTKSEQRFKAIFNSSFQFIGLLTPEGTVLEANQRALDAAGLRADEVVGKPFWETPWWGLCPLTRQRLRESIQSAAQGASIHYETDIWTKDNDIRTLDFSITPLFDHDGKVISLLPEGHDITEIKRTRAALMESEQRFREIADNVDEIFWIRNAVVPKFIYINATYERLTGKSRQSLYDDPLSFLEFIHPDDQPELLSLFNSSPDDNAIIEVRGIDKEGITRWLSIRIFVIKDGHGVIQRRIGIASNITHQKEKELLLTETLEKEKELNHLKSQFVAFVSHEFRTPLATIKSSTELIEHYLFNSSETGLDPELAARIKRHTSTIQTKIDFFDELLTDTLTINQIESGKISYIPQPSDLIAFMQTIILDFFSDRPDGRKAEFEVTGHPETVSIDEKLINRVLINLLSNAFKFSVTNPKVRLCFEEKEVKIKVIDKGIGIPEEDLSKLFTTFFRAGNVGKIAGTGLGLQISKQLVELHGGTIVVNSRQGEGTEMIITLPKH
ncbi:PAS domain S-box protein [Runella slithyformis]|uniref:histidine kinase n=1 Tax=Runella slithyformis (strain ATCC 29530 / DSM 19594 / LMG 11500 / NCIMB 11436 / LSU 4) TaxID=761193 RepID=A0A7U3ZLQ5_RUNSL|nr:PAS domain S-box protein [Runella slithyformis]AEI49508.1 PAS/PAC sensor signal transduction histidine kinase [Runella slithyformis DSM 19594]